MLSLPLLLPTRFPVPLNWVMRFTREKSYQQRMRVESGIAWENWSHASPWDLTGIQGSWEAGWCPGKAPFCCLWKIMETGEDPWWLQKQLLHPSSKKAKRMIWETDQLCSGPWENHRVRLLGLHFWGHFPSLFLFALRLFISCAAHKMLQRYVWWSVQYSAMTAPASQGK